LLTICARYFQDWNVIFRHSVKMLKWRATFIVTCQ